ncbi:inovirus-type Gp2 protein, partial [Serratia sp. ASV30]|uniref:YagK/YfjJ domain-containing protein n=1 Tax=Serratia sp. ASV30 TaxID=2795127 RepID=UPI0018EC1AFF
MSINTASYGLLNINHVKRLKETLDKALREYPRTLVVRVDLKLPDFEYALYSDDPTLITRFITSLKTQMVNVQVVKTTKLRKCGEGIILLRVTPSAVIQCAPPGFH